MVSPSPTSLTLAEIDLAETVELAAVATVPHRDSECKLSVFDILSMKVSIIT